MSKNFKTKDLKRLKNGVYSHKGGQGIIINGDAKEIFVGADAKKNALKRFKEHYSS